MLSQRTKYISSSDNTQFKQIKKLAKSSRERRKLGKTLIDGVHLIEALADAGLVPELILVAEHKYELDNEIMQCLQQFPQIEIAVVNQNLFASIAIVENSVGILAVISSKISDLRVAQVSQCAVLLENIQDPGNLGSILRTAAASGVDSVFLSKGCTEAWSPKALRAGMGAHFGISITENASLNHCAGQYKIVVATSLDANTQIYDIELSENIAFIFGNEGAGLSTELRTLATHQVKIPMIGNVESLNVAAAAAICLYERVRQIQ